MSHVKRHMSNVKFTLPNDLLTQRRDIPIDPSGHLVFGSFGKVNLTFDM